MIRNYFLINLLLITIICFLGIEFYKELNHTVRIPSLTDVEKSGKKMKEEEGRKNIKKFNVAAIDVISQKDLFRPSRTASLQKNENETKPLPQNPPKLFATIILNDMRTAILEDPDTKTTKSYTVNDYVSGYMIVEILKDKVVLSYNDEMIDVKLRDNKGIKSRPSKRSRRLPAKITNSTKKRTPRRVPSRRKRPTTPRNNPAPDELERLLEDMEEIH